MTYTKGDKFKANIEGCESYHRYIHEVTDYIATNVHFEVDEYDASVLLKALNKHESVEFRDDCIVTRIA